MIHVKSKQTSRLTESEAIEATPSWSPDGQKLFFVRFDPEDNSRSIFECDLNGVEKEHVGDPGMSYIYPSLSPDGEYLLFGRKSAEKGSAFQIYTEELSTGRIQLVAKRPVVSYNPSWSADGKHILFINQSKQGITSASVYMVKADGSKLNQLLDCEYGCFQARLSPSGKALLYKHGWAGNFQGIYHYDLQTRESQLIIGKD